DFHVTGVQTCALPILYITGFFQKEAIFDPVDFAAKNLAGVTTAAASGLSWFVSKLDSVGNHLWVKAFGRTGTVLQIDNGLSIQRSEERRVGKECRSRW